MATIVQVHLQAQLNLTEFAVEFNVKNVVSAEMQYKMGVGMQQLDDVTELLKKGYQLDDSIDQLLRKFGTIKAVPEKTFKTTNY